MVPSFLIHHHLVFLPHKFNGYQEARAVSWGMHGGGDVWEEGMGKGKEQNSGQNLLIYWFRVQTFLFLVCPEREPEIRVMEHSEGRGEVDQWGERQWFANLHLPLPVGPGNGVDMKCGSIQTNHLKEKASRVVLGNSVFSHKVPSSANICMWLPV